MKHLHSRSGLRLTSLASLLALLSACGGGDDAKLMQKSSAVDSLKHAQAVHPSVKYPDHHEFEAALDMPYSSTQSGGKRRAAVHLDYLGAPEGQAMAYRVDLIGPDGRVAKRFSGVESYSGKPATVELNWGGAALADGRYTARLSAVSVDAAQVPGAGSMDARFDSMVGASRHGVIEQSWDFIVGAVPKVGMPSFRPLAVGGEEGRRRALSTAAPGSWPYTIYYSSLHGQTNDSDGGGAIPGCSSSQGAQTGAYGPADAFAYAKGRGLDVFATTEHNHYFDGSSGTNSGGSASAARARYQAGLAAATAGSDSSFLALYGMEWGTIAGNGHLNILNSNELFAWEYNSSSELFGDVYTAKGDYAGLYATMRAKGLVGQFNHPDSSDQFSVNGQVFGYNVDGDEVMVLAEITNTSAFSSNTTETETSKSSYEGSFKLFLERGFHVAPATNQDNHCANWGASWTNRTGVLIPTGTPLTKTSFIDALKARRVFATFDKNSQLVFSANGKIMGSRFDNSGALSFNLGFANSGVRTVSSVEIWEGVPGRNGTPTVLSTSPTYSYTPANGQHYYYAKVTQDDGKILWSAPLWVNQSSTPIVDTTPPTVTASESGTSGTITLSASASDNVGVTKVEMWLDGALKSTLSAAPYSMTYDSLTLANGSHALIAKAFDAAGNSTPSGTVNFSISNGGASFIETESNGTIATANVIGTATTVKGTMGSATDKDFFKVSLKAGQKIKVDMVGPSANDYDLYLVTGSGASLAASEGLTSSETFTYTNGATAQTVYIKVVAYSGYSTTQQYTLTISYP